MRDAPSVDDLVAFLSEREHVRKMAEATDAGRPAAEPLAAALIERFGEVVTEPGQPARVGKLIRRVLEEEGFAWVKSGVKTPNNKVFTKASVYRRA